MPHKAQLRLGDGLPLIDIAIDGETAEAPRIALQVGHANTLGSILAAWYDWLAMYAWYEVQHLDVCLVYALEYRLNLLYHGFILGVGNHNYVGSWQVAGVHQINNLITISTSA